MEDNRQIVRCIHCELRQFATSNGNCRKCYQPLFASCKPRPQPAAIPQAPASDIAQGWGAMVRILREERALSQYQLAMRCGFTRTFVSKMEHRKKVPTMRSAARLAVGLDLPFYVLFQTEMSRGYYCNCVLLADPFIAEIHRISGGRLNPAQREILVDTIRSLADHQMSFPEWRTIHATRLELKQC